MDNKQVRPNISEHQSTKKAFCDTLVLNCTRVKYFCLK